MRPHYPPGGEDRTLRGSIEDLTGDRDRPIHERALAIERVRAAAEAAHAAPQGFVLTARAEAFLHGGGDLKEVIGRLQAFEDAGADVLFAPGLPDLDAVRAVTSSVSRPVNVLVMGRLAGASLDDLAQAGAARVSLGSSLAYAAYGALVEMGEAIAGGGFASPGRTPPGRNASGTGSRRGDRAISRIQMTVRMSLSAFFFSACVGTSACAAGFPATTII